MPISQWLPCPTVFAIFHLFSYGPHGHTFMCYVLQIQILWPHMLFGASFCTHCASTLLAHNTTLSLIVSSVSSNVNTSLKILLIMPSSSSPCVNVLLATYPSLYNHILPPLPVTCQAFLGRFIFFCVVFNIGVIAQFFCVMV